MTEQLRHINDSHHVQITDSAKDFFIRFAEQNGASFFAIDEDKKTVYLRIKAIAGGCSGLQYDLSLEESSCEWNPMEETIWVTNDISIMVDSKSQPLLEGLIIDYNDDLMNSGLTFTNPNATSTCGCGKSFR